jgi:signal transduction histidine kinase
MVKAVRPTVTTGGTRRSASFQPLVVGVRWGTFVAGLAMAPVRGPLVGRIVVWTFALLLYSAWRTIRPLELDVREPGLRSVLPFVVEIGLPVGAIVTTGYWESPFALCALTGVVAAGFTRGYAFAVQMAGAAVAAVSIPYVLTGASGASGASSMRAIGQWVVEVVLVAVLAGYARRLFGEAEKRHSQTLDRMAQLAEANELLISLHRVAQQLPASLNLDSVMTSTLTRLRSIIEFDIAAVLMRDDASHRWVIAAGEGTRIGRTFADTELPASLAATTTSSVASLNVCLEPGEGLGPDFMSHSGLYAPLRARGTLVGMLALEHHAPGSYGRRELQLLDGFVDSAALAIDNARWFARLRAIGADEERVRIARDMHDRLGQSLASVGFGLDLIRRQVRDEPLLEDIDRLRVEVRGAVAEVRETLGDLRTDVSDQRGFVETLAGYLERVEARAGLEVNFTHHSGPRLPLNQERELWRIAQEAVTNAERHAGAQHLSVRWECNGSSATLVVADDGKGFVVGRAGRPDSFGLRGMRERADAIGAFLDVDSAPGAGTVVRCRLDTKF